MNIELQWLYKYRPDDIYTIKLLCEQRLHFSHPEDFNDPFDCKPPCSIHFTEETFLASLQDMPYLCELAKTNLKVITESVNKDSNVMSRFVHDTFNALYVCCFSYNVDSPTMWAHYCGNHSGLCLGFDKSIGSTFLNTGTCIPVNYVKERQPIAFPKFSNEQIYKAIEEKYEQWRYEDEVRIVKTPQQMIIHGEWQNTFEKSALVAMFFGLRMPKERQDFYKLLCKQCGLNNVKFYKMTMPTDGSYHLKPVEIELDSNPNA